MKLKPLIASVALLGAVTLSAHASIFSINGTPYSTEFNAGSGANSALMVLEYGSDVYRFGFSWNTVVGQPTPTGWDMLTALEAASTAPALSVAAQTFDFGSGPSEFVQSISYQSHQVTYNYPTSWLGYFVSDDGAPLQTAGTGPSDRVLSNGSYDDWVFQTQPEVAPNYDVPASPVFTVAAAPEPASIGILSIGVLLLVRRQR